MAKKVDGMKNCVEKSTITYFLFVFVGKTSAEGKTFLSMHTFTSLTIHDLPIYTHFCFTCVMPS